MIHISPNYRDLAALIPEHEQRYTEVDRATREEVRSASAECAAASLLNVRESPGGARQVTDSGTVLERHHLYALASVGSEVSAAAQMVGWIAGRHGAGDLWTVGPVIDVLADDGRVPCGMIDGVMYLMLRSIYFHEPKAAPADDPGEGIATKVRSFANYGGPMMVSFDTTGMTEEQIRGFVADMNLTSEET